MVGKEMRESAAKWSDEIRVDWIIISALQNARMGLKNGKNGVFGGCVAMPGLTTDTERPQFGVLQPL